MTISERPAVELLRGDGVDYEQARAWQRERTRDVIERRSTDGGGEALALIQHTPVYTMGARGGWTNLVAAPELLAARGAQLIASDRGGDITFHGPGQLVAYPILDLHRRGLHAAEYVRALESCVIDTLGAFGIEGGRVAGRPGVWVRIPRSDTNDCAFAKIAAIGVRIERGVSRHGLALNVNTDLSWFDAIVPCGIADASMTSLARVLDMPPTLDAVVEAFRAAFEDRFDVRLAEVASTPLAANAVLA